MTDLEDSLSKLEVALRQLEREVMLQALQPGVPNVEVRRALTSVGLQPATDLEALYNWRDGTSTEGVDTLDDIQMFPGFYMLSLKDAISNYLAFVTDQRWSAGWFPVFANGGGDFYLVDLSGEGDIPIRHFRIDESEHPIEFSSLEAMVKTLVRAFQLGVFFVDVKGYLEMDDLGFGSLAADLNPEIDWWTE